MTCLGFNPYIAMEKAFNQGPKTQFFLSVMINRKDPKAKRGSTVKALAISSKYKVLETFTRVVSKVLDVIFMETSVENTKEVNIEKST